jgi:hypothetical protein
MGRVLVLFFAFVFFSSCGDDKPAGILPEETMVPLLTDLHLADGYSATLYSNNSTIDARTVYKAVYSKYNTDSATVNRSLKYYAQHPVQMEKMYTTIQSNLANLLKEDQKRLQRDAQRKLMLEKRKAAMEKMIENHKAHRNKVAKGGYDFGLSTYKWPEERYLKIWKRQLAADSIKSPADTLIKKNLQKVY